MSSVNRQGLLVPRDTVKVQCDKPCPSQTGTVPFCGMQGKALAWAGNSAGYVHPLR